MIRTTLVASIPAGEDSRFAKSAARGILGTPIRWAGREAAVGVVTAVAIAEEGHPEVTLEGRHRARRRLPLPPARPIEEPTDAST